METTVAFQCEASAHVNAEGGGPDKLTVHDGQWAYCPHDSKARGHDWKPVNGLTISTIRVTSAVRELARDRKDGR